MTIASAQNNQFFEKSLDNAKSAAEIVDRVVNELGNLTVARQLASSPKIDRLLGLESGNTATSALFNWVARGSDSDLSILSTAARQLAEKDPAAYSDFQILRKSLATNLADARERINNPSVASQELLRTTTPDVRMTKDAILKLLDLQANQSNEMLNRARLMSSTLDEQGRRIDPNQIRQSNQYKSVIENSFNRKKSILNNEFIKDRLPDFYSPFGESVSNVSTLVPGQTPVDKTSSVTSVAPTTQSAIKAVPKPVGSPPVFTLEAIRAARKRLKEQP